MLLNEDVEVKICHGNYKHYENKGYIIHKELDSKNRITVPYQLIYVKWYDIPHGSSQMMEIKCDGCGKIFDRKVINYYRSHKNNKFDMCKECQPKKSLITKKMKYGTTNPAKIAKQINGNIGRSTKYTIDSLNNLCKEKGYTLTDPELYENKKITLKTNVSVVCNKHDFKFKATVMALDDKDSCNCPKCISENSSKRQSQSTINEVREICQKKNYELLTDDIDNCNSNVEYICKKHRYYGVQNTSLYGLKHYANNCRMCRMPRNEKHFNWKGGISLERDKIQHSLEYKQWVKSVFERDNYTCQCCGKRGTRLEAHHIYNFSDYPSLRTHINNGITLCHECHSVNVVGSFHNTYTTFNNNYEQLKEYISNYRNTHLENQKTDSLLLCSNE